MKRMRANGFTLIELMITVVIVGILAAIALPSYTRYVTQTRRSDAHIALTQIANAQEKFFTQCNHYAQLLHGTTPSICAAAADSSDGRLALNNNAANTIILSPSRHYAVTLVAPTAACPITSCYVLQARPATSLDVDAAGVSGTNQQAGDGNLQLTSVGVKRWDKNNDGTFQTSENTWK